MNARLLLSIPLLVVLTTFAMAFAPAPIFEEPLEPSVPSILTAMQGTWSITSSFQGKGGSRGQVRIRDKTWTMTSSMAKGRERDVADYEILLDTSRNRVTLDSNRNLTARVTIFAPSSVRFATIPKTWSSNSDSTALTQAPKPWGCAESPATAQEAGLSILAASVGGLFHFITSWESPPDVEVPHPSFSAAVSLSAVSALPRPARWLKMRAMALILVVSIQN